jgi:alpha-1,6-mannosyltransferase
MGGQVKRKIINVSPMYLSLAVTFAHVLLSPYTKVEESFTLHAVHDVLAYGHRPHGLSRVSLLLSTAVI